MQRTCKEDPTAKLPATIKFPESDKTPSVCVVGLGYIGLPTASVLADRGYQVHGVDVSENIVDCINRGEIHIHEPHLSELVQRVVDCGDLTASLQPQQADVFFICVPTPIQSNKTPDLTYVRQAARSIRSLVRPGNLVILESTSPPGTTENVVLREAIPDHLTVGEDVFVAYCPERVLPGRILIEVIENDRIVGGITPACAREAVAFYNSFIEGDAYATSAVSAEIVKLAENSYRDVNIAFANELASLAAGFGADPFEIVNLANCHPRVDILRSGPGVGGHCISVDPWFLVAADPQSTSLIRTAREVNDRRPYQIVDQIQTLVQTHKISKVGCLGLAYKADVDDLRESPSLDIVLELRRRGIADIMACDPYVTETEIEGLPLFELDVLVEECDLLVMLTDHSQFLQLPTATLSQKILVDTRGKWKDATERTEATEDQQLVLAAVSQRAA